MLNYEINTNTLAIIPKNEKDCYVYENQEKLIVHDGTINIIKRSCEFFGSSYEGRLVGTTNLLKSAVKAPIYIEETKPIIFFPTFSPRRKQDCCWISYNNLDSYYQTNNGVVVVFKNGVKITLKMSYLIFDNQIIRVLKMRDILQTRRIQAQKAL